MGVLARATSNMDDLLAVKQEMVDRELVLRGAFEDEIKRLTEALDAMTQRMGAIKTLEEAENLRQTWQATAAKGQTEYEALVAKGKAIADDAQARADELVKAKTTAEELQQQAAAAAADYAAKKAALEADYKAKDTALQGREAKLAAAQEKLDADRGELNARASSLQAKIDAANAIKV